MPVLPTPIGIYAILDADTVPVAKLPKLAAGFVQAGVQVFQVRAKNLPGGPFVELVVAIRAALGPKALLLVNDRVDVAALTPSDGVHLGDLDLAPSDARKLLPKGSIVGYSTHSLADISQATDVDYVGFGPVFATATKVTGRAPLGIELLDAACKLSPVPVVAIGGITPKDVATLAKAGASGIAMISGLLLADSPFETAKEATADFFAQGGLK